MFYERFKHLCDINNTTPTQVLKQLNISTSKGTAWKNGSEPSSKYVVLISDLFKVSTDYLLGRTENPNIINQVNTGDVGDHSNVNVNVPNKTELDEMSQELLNKFKELPFDEKIEVFNYIKSRKGA